MTQKYVLCSLAAWFTELPPSSAPVIIPKKIDRSESTLGMYVYLLTWDTYELRYIEG